MRKFTSTVIILFLVLNLSAQDTKSICTKINNLNTEVVNGTVKRLDAAKLFKGLIIELRKSARINHDNSWTFPLQGYTYHAIGGTNGNGYSDKGYNYLDGNKHAAHPAHDIFINDKNQDGIDDRTHQPVNVLAVNDGIVIARTNDWEPSSSLRGGKYIWVYHPAQNILTYYAHNRTIFVKPGDVVKQGQKIAKVGRTGFNAYKKRSPTHLHFSSFKLINDMPIPYNCYQQLTKAKS